MAININVTKDTSLKDLQDFAAKVDDKSRIRAKLGADGETVVLYASKKKSTGLANLLYKNRAEKRTLAKETICDVLGDMHAKRGLFKPSQDPIKLAMRKVTVAVNQEKELRGARFKELMADAGATLGAAKHDVKARVETRKAMRAVDKKEARPVASGSKTTRGEAASDLREDLRAATGADGKHAGLRHVGRKERHIATGTRVARKQAQAAMRKDATTNPFAGAIKNPGHTLATPSLAALSGLAANSPSFGTAGARLAAALTANDKPALMALASELGGILGMDVSGLDRDMQLSFAASRGDGFKDELLGAFAAQLPQAGPLGAGYAGASAELKEFLDATYHTMATNLDDRALDGANIVIGGKQYTEERKIGEGGFGTVHIYKAADGDQIVVKKPIRADAEAFDIVSQEVQAHRTAMAGGHPNIVNMQGAVRTADGKLLIAMDLAPHGTVFDMGPKIAKAVRDGVLSPAAANAVRISLLKDMLEGMRHVQEERGMTHFDLKGPNIFIGKDGKALIADFGLADAVSSRKLHGKLVDNPLWVAPELLTKLNDLDELVSEINTFNKEAYKAAQVAARAEIKALTDSGAPADQIKQLKDQKNAELAALEGGQAELKEEYRKQHEFEVDYKADTWSIGVTAFQLFFQEQEDDGNFKNIDPLVNGESFMTSMAEKIRGFGADDANRIRTLGKDASGQAVGEGVSALDRMLNRLMHPDPTQRPSLTEALSMSIFDEPGVDADETRELITLLGGNPRDDARIRELSASIGA